MRVADLTETELLARIVPRLPAGTTTLLGPGDDAAVVAAPDGRFVVSTDVLVEDHHFRTRWSTGADVGYRAAMQNLADIAAMGARPTSLVVGLVMPPDTAVAWVEGLADGLAQACAPHGVGVVGGDLTAGPVLMVAVTVHGDLEGRDAVLRGGARPGDVVAHSGVLGRSAAGWALLEADLRDLPGGEALIESHLRPTAPLTDGPDAARAGVTAMMDVSDGLLRDGARIAAASGVRLDLASRDLLLAVEGLETAAEACAADPMAWVLTGGEDHGLLATFPADAPLPPAFRRLGTVIGPGAGPAVLVDGGPPPVAGVGWDHFQNL